MMTPLIKKLFFLTIPVLLLTQALSAETGYENINLPKIKGVTWVTNLDEPVFGNPNTQKGGTFRDYLQDFPLTFRLYGPESNSGGFVTYKRRYAFMSLVDRHPVTLKHIPELATHWAIMPDNKTVYYHLDADARWSDGKPITAGDYVYILEFMTSEHIQDKYYNNYYKEHFESIEAVQKNVVKITLKKPSWQILDDTNLSPIPKHDTVLDKNWLNTYQWKMSAVPGPYVIESFKKGETVNFKKIKNWWGNDKHYMKYKYNFDTIKLRVIRLEETAYVSFKKGELDIFSLEPKKWVRQTRFKETQKGYILKRKIKKRVFNGAFGIFFNVKDPIWSDINLRRAFAHVFDFDTMNRNYMFDFFERRHKFFHAIPPYDNPPVKSYPFDIKEAGRLLDLAGWKRVKSSPYRQKNGVPLILTLNYGGERYDEQLPFLQQTALKAGINLELKKMDSPALFKSVGDKTYTAVIIAYGGGFFPAPHQFFHTENVIKNSNNLTMFGSKEMDKLIDTYEYNMDEKERVKAYNRIEQIQNDMALTLQFWFNPNILILNWRYIKGPKEFISVRGLNIDYLWFDRQEYDDMKKNMRKNKAMPLVEEVSNPYHL